MFKVVKVLANPRRPYAVVDPNGNVITRYQALDTAVQDCLSRNTTLGTPGVPRIATDSSGVRPSNNRGLNPPPDPLVIIK